MSSTQDDARNEEQAASPGHKGHRAGLVGVGILSVFLLMAGEGEALAQQQPPKQLVEPGAPAGKPSIRVAAVQLTGYDKGELPREGFDPAGKVVGYLERAAGDNAQGETAGLDLMVFPEYVLGHIDVPGPETQRIAKAVRRAGCYVVVGCWEKLAVKKFANAILLFGRDGELVGKYYKTHPAIDHFEGEPAWLNPPVGRTREWFLANDPEWIMQAGQQLPIFELDFGKVGILTCYDGWFPEPARVLSLKGAELLLWVNGRRGIVEDFIVKSTTFQSQVAMVSTNQAYGGGTMIGQFPAQVVARAPDRQEALIEATIDLRRLRTARANSRNFRQRRPDLYGELTKPLRQNRPAPQPVEAPGER
ncbi:MAG: carbon-nitrogen hydrolase family protein [Planctomycetales bacterium]|nr:carbon-nitrogen hydrolase family protein [Planctomycetales bacterium]